jgi:hypothetical protein
VTEQASIIITLGRTLAEQYQRNPVANQLSYLAYPTRWKQAMQAAADEEQYFAKCQALGGISMDDARQALDNAIARADRLGLPVQDAYSRAWEEVIERTARVSVSPWQELLTSRSFPADKLEEIKDGLLRMAGEPETSTEPVDGPTRR